MKRRGTREKEGVDEGSPSSTIFGLSRLPRLLYSRARLFIALETRAH